MKLLRIMRKKEVLHLCGISNATLYRLIKDGQFPSQLSLTGARGRAVGWHSEDIEHWIENRNHVDCNSI